MASSTSSTCISAGRISAQLLLGFFCLLPATLVTAATAPQQQIPLVPGPVIPIAGEESHTYDLKLRHIFQHGTAFSHYPHFHRRKDIPPSARVYLQDDEDKDDKALWTLVQPHELRVNTKPTSIHRLANRQHEYVEGIMAFGQETGYTPTLPVDDWTVEEVQGPNVTDQQTVLSLARMAANAYVKDNSSSEWFDVGPGFNYTSDFGWEEDGLRGHVFVDTNNKTVVVGIKGTSLGFWDGSGSVGKDRINDNLLFSCCCGYPGFFYYKVCDCMSASYKCNSTCLTESLRKKTFYYHAAADIYRNVSNEYPESDIWFVGHSLGGAVASLTGMTYGFPVVAFQSPGESMAAKRLHLPTPPRYELGTRSSDEDDDNAGPQPPFRGVYHFGHNADPIFTGECRGLPCSEWGYAMESQCHAGLACVYNTTGDFGWSRSILNHRINFCISDVYTKYKAPAKCIAYEDCADCSDWKFFESNGTEKTSTSTSSTSVKTCETPGWFGCLDETTTSAATSTTTTTEKTTSAETTSTSTTTCKTPGWFGCKDPTTTTVTTSASPAPTITTIPSATASATSAASASSSLATTSCKTPGYIWGCKDRPTPDGSSSSQMTAAITKAYNLHLGL